MNVTNGQFTEWMSSKLRDKFMYWKSQSWPFHVCLKVFQGIMEPMILYYLPLLPWTKKALHYVLQHLRYLLWKKRDKMEIVFLFLRYWDCVIIGTCTTLLYSMVDME